MHMAVCLQRTCHQVRQTVQALDTLIMISLVYQSLPTYMLPIFHVQVFSYGVAGLTDHTDLLPHVCP